MLLSGKIGEIYWKTIIKCSFKGVVNIAKIKNTLKWKVSHCWCLLFSPVIRYVILTLGDDPYNLPARRLLSFGDIHYLSKITPASLRRDVQKLRDIWVSYLYLDVVIVLLLFTVIKTNLCYHFVLK